MIPAVRIVVHLQPPGKPVETPIVGGWVTQQPSAQSLDDAEANAVRIAEQMVREAFAKFRARGEDMRSWKEVENAVQAEQDAVQAPPSRLP